MSNPLFKLEASISAVRAFNDLITAALNQGEDMSSVAAGVFILLNTQVDALSEAEKEIRAELSSLKSRLEMSALNSHINNNNDLELSAGSAPNYSAGSHATPGTDYYRENQLLIARLHAEGKTVEEIGALTGLSRDRIRIFIEAMPEYVLEEVRTQADPRELRSAFIAERIRDGYNSSEIANALNLKKITVEKVINRLLNAGDGNAANLRRAGNE